MQFRCDGLDGLVRENEHPACLGVKQTADEISGGLSCHLTYHSGQVGCRYAQLSGVESYTVFFPIVCD